MKTIEQRRKTMKAVMSVFLLCLLAGCGWTDPQMQETEDLPVEVDFNTYEDCILTSLAGRPNVAATEARIDACQEKFGWQSDDAT